MKHLIKLIDIEIDDEEIKSVDARKLHAFLESKQDFSTWIKIRIKQYGFVINKDYLIHKIVEQLPSGSKIKKEYYISLDMAKELSMVERNDQGKRARQYFIECEKIARKKEKRIPKSEHWRQSRYAIAVGYKIMCDMLFICYKQNGKEADKFTYMNNSKLINSFINGKFGSIDRDNLTIEQINFIHALQLLNTRCIGQGLSYKERKEILLRYAGDYKLIIDKTISLNIN